MTQPTQPFYVL